jgi:hypothetical protein
MMSLLCRSWIPLTLAAFVAACSSASPSRKATDGVGASEAVDYLIVAANPLAASADQLAAFRASTGHEVAVGLVGDILGDETGRAAAALKLRDWVKARYDRRDPSRPFFLALLGDATDDATVDGSVVPAGEFVDANGTKILTDNVYADMDGDDLPDLAVGRIAVASAAEASAVLEKTKRFETSYEVGEWNRRLSLFASTAGFLPEIDAQIEAVVFKLVEEIPYDFDINLTYAKQTSPYVYVPEKFSDKVYERMNEGSLMMTYVGHGYENGFADLEWNGERFPILDTAQLSKLAVAHKAPVLSLIACLTGRFNAGESLSERILKAAAGPVAVYSSTEVSHPYANAVFIREVGQAVTTERVATVGEIFARAKRRSIESASDAIRKEIDDGVAGLLPADVRTDLLRSHLYMYELFGDPAARVAYPRHVAKLTIPATAKAGTGVSVSVAVEGLAKGTALVTLEDRRSSAPRAIQAVPPDGDPNRDTVIAQNYAQANDRVLSKQRAVVDGGLSQVTLTVPAELAAGDYYVKVYADDGASDAVGSAKITVQ